jgi:hypothetical protein
VTARLAYVEAIVISVGDYAHMLKHGVKLDPEKEVTFVDGGGSRVNCKYKL